MMRKKIRSKSAILALERRLAFRYQYHSGICSGFIHAFSMKLECSEALESFTLYSMPNAEAVLKRSYPESCCACTESNT